MDLYLIRHADAKPLGEDGVQDDAERALTEKGHAQSKMLAAALQKRGVHLGLVVASPLVRARQTASCMLSHWAQPTLALTECEEVAPGGKPGKLSKFLRKQKVESVAVVGHMPGIGEYAAWLIGSKKAQVDLAKAGVACISFPEGPRKGEGSLRWLVTPTWYE
jgi:phosphohistidine phosphatase